MGSKDKNDEKPFRKAKKPNVVEVEYRSEE
jgi:hypothetical protein